MLGAVIGRRRRPSFCSFALIKNKSSFSMAKSASQSKKLESELSRRAWVLFSESIKGGSRERVEHFLPIVKKQDLNWSANSYVRPLQLAARWGRTEIVHVLMEDAAETVPVPIPVDVVANSIKPQLSQSAKVGVEKAISVLGNKKHRNKKTVSRLLSNMAYWDPSDEHHQKHREKFGKVLRDVSSDASLGLGSKARHRLKRMLHHLSLNSEESQEEKKDTLDTLDALQPAKAAEEATGATGAIFNKMGQEQEDEDEERTYVLSVSDPLKLLGGARPHLRRLVNARARGPKPPTSTSAGTSNGTPTQRHSGTALHAACSEGHHETVCVLLGEYLADVDVSNDFLRTPLHVAASVGNLDIVRTLCETIFTQSGPRRGFEYVRKLDRAGSSALHGACAKGHVGVVAYLVTGLSEWMARSGLEEPFIGGDVTGISTDSSTNDVDSAIVSGIGSGRGRGSRRRQGGSALGVDVDVRALNGLTPLHLACRRGLEDVVRVLTLEGRATVDVSGSMDDVKSVKGPKPTEREGKEGSEPREKEKKYTSTGLEMACHAGHYEVARLLAEDLGASLGGASFDGRNTPLHSACYEGHMPVAKMLVREGARRVQQAELRGDTSPVAGHIHREGWLDVNAKNRARASPLSLAAARGHANIVHMLLVEGGAHVSQEDSQGHTPLYLAAQNGHTEVVRCLVRVGQATPDVRLRTNSMTPLMAACYKGRIDCVVMLLQETGADAGAVDLKLGYNALLFAASQGHADLVRVLLTLGGSGADVTRTCRDGNTALHVAIAGAHPETARVLVLEGGAEVDDRAWEMASASESSNEEVLRLLRQKREKEI